LAADPCSASAIAATRTWQQDCGITINQLSGGSKAHWLARSFSEAFLLRSVSGLALEGAAPGQIVERLLDVLKQAVRSLAEMEQGTDVPGDSSALSESPPPRRFEFVRSLELRPMVERAYLESRRALERQDYPSALLNSCGVLEAIVTDALAHNGMSALAAAGAPAGEIADWSFETRLAVAERAGLIRGGCARLPAVARRYRDSGDVEAARDAKPVVSERDARLAGQVLHVVMRDLDPGR